MGRQSRTLSALHLWAIHTIQNNNDDVPPMRGFYRWHIPDPIRFNEDLRVTVQQIGVSKKELFGENV
ncbi:DUF2961 domain-containing protein [Bacillus sp. SD088]|uniref:DUF2961 domain-containing protein n=1 Tax=Bacillus sp. SD088 TaxID=2782012 RepID=UPI001F615019|nr:DUF2961 domain-containing protein [Bacillus sp. SD088]